MRSARVLAKRVGCGFIGDKGQESAEKWVEWANKDLSGAEGVFGKT
jgi:hypothetical protein